METIIDARLLKPKMPLVETTWRLWEKKSLNIHRGVLEWSVDPSCESATDLALRIREGVKAEFRPGWLRGFGFGTVLHFRDVSSDWAQIRTHIDTRNRSVGVWQWAILRFDDDKVAIGVHTWAHGYLRPVFDSIMGQLEENGYECKSADVEMDKLIATLNKVAAFDPIVILARTLSFCVRRLRK